MTDRPEDRPEERRRTGPLGDDAETQAVGPEGRTEPTPRERTPEDEGATRQIPAEEAPDRTRETHETREAEDDTALAGGMSRRERRAAAREDRTDEDKETRVIRTPGSGTGGTAESAAYPRGYFEAAEEREDRLRDMYGGVDWLASFLGFVFAAVAAGVLSLIAGLILVPLGFSLDLGSGELGATVITGLVILGILIFLTYFFGGYIAGRLARFDGGRNGVMTVVWALVVGVLILAVSPLLPGAIFDNVQNFMQGTVLPTIGGLSNLGILGIAIIAAILLVAILGGLLGGRVGSRYHSEIDRTT